MYQLKSDIEISELARGVIDGSVFTSLQIRNMEDWPSHFLPLALMDDKQVDELKTMDIRCLYSYSKDFSPMGLNGLPMCLSMGILNESDTNRLVSEIQRMQRALSGIQLPERSLWKRIWDKILGRGPQ